MGEALNAQDLDAHDRCWHEAVVWHGPPGFGDIHGLEGFKDEVLRPFSAAFSDHHAVNDIEVASGRMVAATGFVTGTQHGPWMGLPPTGQPMRMRFSDFWSVEDGRLRENWVMVDLVDAFRQLGVDLLAIVPRG